MRSIRTCGETIVVVIVNHLNGFNRKVKACIVKYAVARLFHSIAVFVKCNSRLTSTIGLGCRQALHHHPSHGIVKHKAIKSLFLQLTILNG